MKANRNNTMQIDSQGLQMLEWSDLEIKINTPTLVKVVKDKKEKFGWCVNYKKRPNRESGTDQLMMKLEDLSS